MESKWNVLIVGAGNMGAFFDKPEDETVFTHAHGASLSADFRLLGFVDIDIEKATRATNLWGGKAFGSISEAFQNTVDVVCITVPDDYHYAVLKEVANYPVKFVFTEKPLAKKLSEAKEILDLYKDKNIKAGVNYTRRFIPEFQEIRDNIKSGALGKYLGGSGYYGKGVMHNGSHLVDFVRFMLGDILDAKGFSKDYDFGEDDPGVSGVLMLNDNKIFTLNHVNCENYSVFEIDLLFEKKRVRIVESGFKMEVYDVVGHPNFSDYKSLGQKQEIKTSSYREMYHVMENIGLYLHEKAELNCTLEDAYKAILICHKLKDGALL